VAGPATAKSLLLIVVLVHDILSTPAQWKHGETENIVILASHQLLIWADLNMITENAGSRSHENIILQASKAQHTNASGTLSQQLH